MRQSQVRPFNYRHDRRPDPKEQNLWDSRETGTRALIDPDFDRQGGRVSLSPDTGRRLAARRLEV